MSLPLCALLLMRKTNEESIPWHPLAFVTFLAFLVFNFSFSHSPASIRYLLIFFWLCFVLFCFARYWPSTRDIARSKTKPLFSWIGLPGEELDCKHYYNLLFYCHRGTPSRWDWISKLGLGGWPRDLF